MKVAFVSQGILLLLLCAQLAISTPIEDDLDLSEDEELELKEERLFEDIPLAPFKDTVLQEVAVEAVEEAPKVKDAEEVKEAVKEATDVKEAALDIPAVVELPQAVPEPVPTNVLGAEVPAEAPAETPIEPPAGLKLAQQCDSSVCKLPNCRCSDAILPSEEFEGHEKEIPQFITVTFDDAVNAINYKQYEEMFADLVNPDHCTARGTFFVSHEYTDYSKLNALYNEGHEIALHSITHGQGTDYWLEGDVELFKREFGQQLELIEQFAKIDHKHVHGLRLPFLQLAGNNSFIAAQELGLQYDSSWPTQQFKDPPMWPYTLDYKSTQDCMIKPCPTASIPGFWVQPMVTWTDLKGYSCAMIDACVYPPENNVEEIYNWILKNFNRHYESNRAPFGMYLHAAWFARGSHNFEAMRKFLEYANTLPDVYITTPARVLQYVKHPVLGKPFKGCVKKPKTECRPVSCNLPKGDDGEMRYMTVCDRCPSAYPWLDNPLGKRIKRRK